MPSVENITISPTVKVKASIEIMEVFAKTKYQNENPQDILKSSSDKWQLPLSSESFAQKLDEIDPLKHMRQEFFIPKIGGLPKADESRTNPEDECIYFCGHSLGLQPKRVRKFIDSWLDDWAHLGVYGHIYGTNPFAFCDYPCIPTLNQLLGAEDNEVGVMNQLTTNLHFLMISFYRPTTKRFKILYEHRAFPSDEYAIYSQIRLNGYDPKEATIALKPRPNENCIRTEDILQLLRDQGQSIALVLLSGVQFYTGQLFDIETITRVGQEHGCTVGWDMAHAIGNVPLKLHDWNVDFAAFCTYKYLNSSAGSIGGIFVHSKHFDKDLIRLDGWWGNKDETRFQMNPEIERGTGANGFRISNPSVQQCATLAASLQVFNEAGIENLRTKSKLLTQYLEYLLETEINKSPNNFKIEILTPKDAEQRGAQLSLRFIGVEPRQIFIELEKRGVCLDLRGDVIRIAPIPLYNTFIDVYRFVSHLKALNI